MHHQQHARVISVNQPYIAFQNHYSMVDLEMGNTMVRCSGILPDGSQCEKLSYTHAFLKADNFPQAHVHVPRKKGLEIDVRFTWKTPTMIAMTIKPLLSKLMPRLFVK